MVHKAPDTGVPVPVHLYQVPCVPSEQLRGIKISPSSFRGFFHFLCYT